jgi:hypothetical protein
MLTFSTPSLFLWSSYTALDGTGTTLLEAPETGFGPMTVSARSAPVLAISPSTDPVWACLLPHACSGAPEALMDRALCTNIALLPRTLHSLAVSSLLDPWVTFRTGSYSDVSAPFVQLGNRISSVARSRALVVRSQREFGGENCPRAERPTTETEFDVCSSCRKLSPS